MPLIDLNIFETEPAEIYHARSKEFLSSHQLIEFMQCPYLYQKRRAGLVTEKDNVPLHRNPTLPRLLVMRCNNMLLLPLSWSLFVQAMSSVAGRAIRFAFD